jgi:hypothetical protein
MAQQYKPFDLYSPGRRISFCHHQMRIRTFSGNFLPPSVSKSSSAIKQPNKVPNKETPNAL